MREIERNLSSRFEHLIATISMFFRNGSLPRTRVCGGASVIRFPPYLPPINVLTSKHGRERDCILGSWSCIQNDLNIFQKELDYWTRFKRYLIWRFRFLSKKSVNQQGFCTNDLKSSEMEINSAQKSADTVTSASFGTASVFPFNSKSNWHHKSAFGSSRFWYCIVFRFFCKTAVSQGEGPAAAHPSPVFSRVSLLPPPFDHRTGGD